MEKIIELINEMSPYLLLGFLLAGLMHAFVPGTVYSRYLSKANLKSVLLATLFGIPLPLCSCGVIPTAMSLRKEGASKGATASFLIATPQTGVDSIVATFALMGLPFAIIRPIVALITAVCGGIVVNAVEGKDAEGEVREDRVEDKHCECNKSLLQKLGEALRYAYLDMMQDIGKWLVIGLVVAGLITTLVPGSFFEVFKDNSLLSMLLVLCFAVPMYLCATGSIPIAVALMLKGLTPGAALVMLMAGPACNMASVLVINKVMGRRTLIAYLASIVTGAIGFGLVIDHLLPREWFISDLVAHDACCHEETSWFAWACTGLLFVLLVNALVLAKFKSHGHSDCGCCHCHDHEENAGISNLNTNKMTYTIKGMNCNHCRMSAEKAILACNGVTAANVELAGGKATIEGNYDLNEVKAAVDALGFTFELS